VYTRGYEGILLWYTCGYERYTLWYTRVVERYTLWYTRVVGRYTTLVYTPGYVGRCTLPWYIPYYILPGTPSMLHVRHAVRHRLVRARGGDTLGSNLGLLMSLRRIEPSFSQRCVGRAGTLRWVLPLFPLIKLIRSDRRRVNPGKSPMVVHLCA